jgi:hypothetical protein
MEFRRRKKVTEPAIIEPIIEEEINLLCEEDKYASYTNIDTINILWEYIDVQDYYIDNGIVKESATGAILVAMGTHYELDQYYMITFSNGFEIYVKNIDVKAEEHTDQNNCYTTSDNTIIELWVTNEFDYLSAGISKYTDFGSVVKIERR